MRSPLLNSTFDSAVRSPCIRITSTPESDSRIPNACASVSRTPSRMKDHNATINGPEDCNSSVFSAWVYSSAQYCRTLKMPIPVIDRKTMMPRCFRIMPQSRTKCVQAKGRINRNASDQRRKDSVTGGMCPAASRPTMAFPAQHAAVMLSKR